jgi:hypothetical protein
VNILVVWFACPTFHHLCGSAGVGIVKVHVQIEIDFLPV